MLLGMPCVATNTGGTMDILKHKEEGLLYHYCHQYFAGGYFCYFTLLYSGHGFSGYCLSLAVLCLWSADSHGSLAGF